MKVSKEQIKQMKEMKEEGLTYIEIARRLKIRGHDLVKYHLDKDYREKRKQIVKERYKKLPKKVKRELNQKQAEYRKRYYANKYKNDPEFREKQKERMREYLKRKKNE